MLRYLALIFAPENLAAAHFSTSLADWLRDECAPWQIVFRSSGALVICRRATAGYQGRWCRLADRKGVVVGTLFRRTRDHAYSRCTSDFDQRETANLHATRGRALVDEYWGNYVAFIQ